MHSPPRRLAIGLGLALVASTALAGAQAVIPPPVNLQPHAMGTWRLDLARSRYTPGPAPRRQTRTYRYLGQGLETATTDTVDAQGNKTPTIINVYRYDGRDYPAAAPGAATSYRNIDEYTMEYTQKLNGNVRAVITRTVSRDGRTMTHHAKGTNAQGQPIDNYMVFTKR